MDMQTTDHKWGEKRPQEEGRTNCEETSQPYFAVCWDGHTPVSSPRLALDPGLWPPQFLRIL